MKVTSATVRLVLKKNKVNKNGEHPIHVVVCFSGRHEKSTGISVKEKDWDSRRECIKASAPNAPVLNRMILDVKQRILDKKSEYEYAGKRYTPQMLLEASVLDLRAKDGDFWDVCLRLIDERRLRDGTVRSYTYCYRKLKEYLKREHFIVDELVLGVVKDFAVWLEKGGIKINTIKRVLSCIAAVWNYAISRKLVAPDGYPFSEFRYTSIYHECPRDYYLTEDHMVRLKDYWLNMVIERDGNRWHYKPGVEERLHQRWTAEFGILWFLQSYRCNGSSPIELALLTPDKCKRVSINGEDYWSIDIRRRKTSRDVHIRLKRDLLTIIGFEHFIGSCGRYVYPILYWHDGCSDKYLLEQSHKAADKAMIHVRRAFERINLDIARDNVENGLTEPLVDPSRLVFYTQRHSFAQHYLNRPGATVNGLASLMARSHNTIATYLRILTRDEELVELTANMPI